MYLGWSSPSLRELCTSREGLVQANPTHGADAQLLLQTLAQAQVFAEVAALQCLRTTVRGDELEAVTASIGFREVELQATLITLTQSVARSPVRPRPAEVGMANAMRMETLLIQGHQVLEVAVR